MKTKILPPAEMKELCGTLHLHTRYSDGGVHISELIEAAQSLNLDFIGVTDHMSLGAKSDGYEGFHQALFVLVGYEHHDSRKLNHYLAFGVDSVSTMQKPQQYIDATKKQGGVGFLAHPAEKRNYFRQYPPYPWVDWQASGYDGIEIWNQMSEWVENLKSRLSYIRIFYPRRFLGTVPENLLYKWDALNKQRFVSGIGGVDAHTIQIGPSWFGLRIFPIRVELQGIRTHVWIPRQVKDDKENYKQVLLSKLRDGNGFISNFRRGDARGAQMIFQDAKGVRLCPGKHQYVPRLPGVLTVSIPAPASITLIRNGSAVAAVEGTDARFPIRRQGVYRLEVFKRRNAWIYSNPFPIGEYPFN
ncbi:MAG: PHP domain-containing protein [Chitinispirillaceae bacterium]